MSHSPREGGRTKIIGLPYPPKFRVNRVLILSRLANNHAEGGQILVKKSATLRKRDRTRSTRLFSA